MPRPATDKRERLTAAATTLAATRGLSRTSLGDIASEAGVAQGSVYYYFRTKEDVARAVIAELSARDVASRQDWSEHEDPRDRLVAYIDSHAQDADDIRAHGCPVGSLCADLRMTSAELADEAASVLRATIDWAAEQFAALGFEAGAAQARALHLVTGIQGAAALANALDDAEPLTREAAHLRRWVASTQA